MPDGGTYLTELRQASLAQSDPYLRLREVEREAGLSKSAIYRRIAEGSFPPPKDLGGGVRRWLASGVTAWKQGHGEAGGQVAQGDAGGGEGAPDVSHPPGAAEVVAAKRGRGRPRKTA